MTLISENMIKNAKNVPKIRFLELKCSKNDISKFNMMLCLGIKNHEKMILAWLFYPTTSFGIIVQNSSIGQKFRQLRAPETGNICWSLENERKYRRYIRILLLFSLFLRRAGWQKFLTDRQFLIYDVIWVVICNYMHIWHLYLKIWSKLRKCTTSVWRI